MEKEYGTESIHPQPKKLKDGVFSITLDKKETS